MFKYINRIRKIEKRQREILQKRDHLSTWQRLSTPIPRNESEEYQSLENERKEICNSLEWKEEVKERLKLYRQDERFVKLENEINSLSRKLISAGYFPHSYSIE